VRTFTLVCFGIGAVVAAVACPGFFSASAAEFPTKPVRLVVPLSPGGPADTVARLVAPQVSERLGQPVVVDNRAGASTIVGTEIVARSPADGYTMLMITTTHTVNPSVIRKLPYDLASDFTPVTLTASAPFAIVVNPQVAARNVKELIELARSRPGAINYGTSGIGSSMHLTTALFESAANISMTHIPYKGAGPALIDLLGWQLLLVSSCALAAMPHVVGGRLRAIAVTSLRRLAAMPSLPTVAESGFPGFESSSWNGVVLPAKTPQGIVSGLHRSIAAVVTSAPVAERLAKEGAEAGGNSPAEFAAYIRSETTKWASVIKRIGIKPE
jgi:tripartite-type tricarboxylate transporter receptor subunit TctC